MKLEGWIAVINDGWIGDSDQQELMKRLKKEFGSDWPVCKIKITVSPEAEAITIPPSEEAKDGR